MQGDTPISSGQALMARFILEAKQLQLKMELAEDSGSNTWFLSQTVWFSVTWMSQEVRTGYLPSWCSKREPILYVITHN